MAILGVDLVELTFLEWISDEEQARQANYVAYRDYYTGDQKTQLPERQKRFLELASDAQFCSNYCALVVDALRDRLVVTGIVSGDDALDARIAQWLEASRFDALQQMVHLQALIDGDTYVMVDWDYANSRPRLTMQYAYTDSTVGGTGDGVRAHYSDEQNGVMLFASKRWVAIEGEGTGTTRYVNVYYPDRVEKYRSTTGEAGWTLYDRFAWVDIMGRPLGIPIVHFANRALGIGNWGESEMRRAIPLQDWLNHTVIDLVGAADVSAFPIMVLSGANPTDELEIHPGMVLGVSDPSGSASWLTPGNLSQLMSLAEYISMEIARVTDTPVSRFQTTAQRASAATLQEEERGLVAKAEQRQCVFGNAWEDVVAMMLRMAARFGGEDIPDPLPPLRCNWEDPTTPNEQALVAKAQLMLNAGIPLEWIAKRFWGIDDGEWSQIEEMKQRAELHEGNVGALLMRNFERGLLANGQGVGEEQAGAGENPQA